MQPETVCVPGGCFTLRVTHRCREGGCQSPQPASAYDHGPRLVACPDLVVDRHPVSNQQYYAFLQDSGYQPPDAHNFLRHWQDGQPPVALRDQPVVWVSYRDAQAYADWAGQRLLTDEEWQWVAGGTKEGTPTTIASCGEVWEMVAPLYDDGWHQFLFLRGGCRYQAEGSIWYPDATDLPMNSHLKFFLLNEGLNRCGTVGFRCVREGERGKGG